MPAAKLCEAAGPSRCQTQGGAGGWVVYADFGPFTRYFRTDHLGSISAITNEAAQYLHTAFLY
jgi:hypothetical protein